MTNIYQIGPELTYTFMVEGRPLFQCKARNRLNAFVAANAHFSETRSAGCWSETFTSRVYEWREGNFFD